jgi:hypothetical protein
MGQCIPLHHVSGAAGCSCGATHSPTEADALNRVGGIIGFVCIRGGPPVRDRKPCAECGDDYAVKGDGTMWTHTYRDSGLRCYGSGRAPAAPTLEGAPS